MMDDNLSNAAGALKLFRTTSHITILVISIYTFIILVSFSASMISISASNQHRIESIEELLYSNYDVLMEVGNSNSTIRLMLEVMVIEIKIEMMKRLYEKFISFKLFL